MSNQLQNLVECDICHEMIEIEDAYAVLDHTYVCTPELYPECLWEYNNQNYVRSEFYD